MLTNTSLVPAVLGADADVLTPTTENLYVFCDTNISAVRYGDAEQRRCRGHHLHTAARASLSTHQTLSWGFFLNIYTFWVYNLPCDQSPAAPVYPGSSPPAAPAYPGSSPPADCSGFEPCYSSLSRLPLQLLNTTANGILAGSSQTSNILDLFWLQIRQRIM